MFKHSLCSCRCAYLNIVDYCEISPKFSSKQNIPMSKSADLDCLSSSGELVSNPFLSYFTHTFRGISCPVGVS